MGRRIKSIIQRIKELSKHGSNSLSSERRRITLLIFSCLGSGCKCSVDEGEGKKKKHVFYTSKMILDVETMYNAIENMVLALMTTKK